MFPPPGIHLAWAAEGGPSPEPELSALAEASLWEHRMEPQTLSSPVLAEVQSLRDDFHPGRQLGMNVECMLCS